MLPKVYPGIPLIDRVARVAGKTLAYVLQVFFVAVSRSLLFSRTTILAADQDNTLQVQNQWFSNSSAILNYYEEVFQLFGNESFEFGDDFRSLRLYNNIHRCDAGWVQFAYTFAIFLVWLAGLAFLFIFLMVFSGRINYVPGPGEQRGESVSLCDG